MGKTERLGTVDARFVLFTGQKGPQSWKDWNMPGARAPGAGGGEPHCGKGGYQWPGGESAPERARGSLWVDIPAPDDKTRAGRMHLRRLDQGKGTKKGNGKVTNAETEP